MPSHRNFRCTRQGSLKLAVLSLESALTTSRLTSKQARLVGSNRTFPLVHYAGPKKPIISAALNVNTTGSSYTEVWAQQAQSGLLPRDQGCTVAQQPKARARCNGVEWIQPLRDRKHGVVKSVNTYIFGSLINAPPSYTDTILTTLTYIWRSLVDIGNVFVHFYLVMQLFAVTKTVCWHQPLQFKNVIVDPWGMHIMQSFIACIAKLMKRWGLGVCGAAAFKGLNGIFNGTSWVKEMRKTS